MILRTNIHSLNIKEYKIRCNLKYLKISVTVPDCTYFESFISTLILNKAILVFSKTKLL